MRKILIITALTFGSLMTWADQPYSNKRAHQNSNIEKIVKVEIGSKGFHPESPLNFEPNENVVLKVKRTTDKTCMTELKHPTSGKLVTLPRGKEVRIELGSYTKPTEVLLLCGMGMKAGVVLVRSKTSKI